MQPTPMTVTVFGGTGFIGGCVVRDLARRGFRVKIACRVPERAYDLKLCGQVGQVVPVACRFDRDSVRDAIKGASFVVNCVGILSEKRGATFQRVHAGLPELIAEACRDEKTARLVHVSALGCDAAGSRYARSKKAGEEAMLRVFPRASILRPGPVFGPDDSFFNLFARLSLLFPALPLIGGGHTRLQPVYVGDVAAAVVACLTLPESPGGPCGRVYELGGPDVLDFRAVYEKIFAVTGRRRLMLPLPWTLAKIDGAILSLLPRPPLTADQVETLKTDAVVAQGAPGLSDLGIASTGLDLILPTYLDRYRPGGRLGTMRKAA